MLIAKWKLMTLLFFARLYFPPGCPSLSLQRERNKGGFVLAKFSFASNFVRVPWAHTQSCCAVWMKIDSSTEAKARNICFSPPRAQLLRYQKPPHIIRWQRSIWEVSVCNTVRQVDENEGKNWALEIMLGQGCVSLLWPGKPESLLLKSEWHSYEGISKDLNARTGLHLILYSNEMWFYL